MASLARSISFCQILPISKSLSQRLSDESGIAAINTFCQGLGQCHGTYYDNTIIMVE